MGGDRRHEDQRKTVCCNKEEGDKLLTRQVVVPVLESVEAPPASWDQKVHV
jgi:hypothetical protein